MTAESATSVPPGPPPPAKSRPIATLLLFGLLGPIIGYFVFAMMLPGVFYPNATSGERANFTVMILIFTPFLLFSHVLGGIPALSTGVCLLLADRYAPRSIPLAIVAVVAGATTSYLWAGFKDPADGMAVMMPISGAVAGLLCYAIARKCKWLTR